MQLKDFIEIAKNHNGERFTNIVLFDLDGNYICWDELYILDYYAIMNWLVEEITIRETGYVEIMLNGGNFRNFMFRNVRPLDKEEK